MRKLSLRERWQSRWDQEVLPNKFKTVISDWSTSYRARKEEVTIARLRLNATMITHMEPYILRTFPSQCQTCRVHCTINHLLISCKNYEAHRDILRSAASRAGIPFTAHNLLQDDEELIHEVISFLIAANLMSKI